MFKKIVLVLILSYSGNNLLAAQPLPILSLEEIALSSLDDQEISENNETPYQDKPSLTTWCNLQLQHFALVCALKYYTVKTWIKQTVLQRTT